MAKKLNRMEMIEICSGIINSNLLETHMEEGLGGYDSLERQALIGAALSQLGAEITAAAKKQAMSTYGGTRGKQIDGRLIIEYRPGGQQTRVDSGAIRKDLPPDEYPMYWKKVNTRESISISIGEKTAEPAPAFDPDEIPF